MRFGVRFSVARTLRVPPAARCARHVIGEIDGRSCRHPPEAPPFLTMRDVSLNPIRPLATGLTWLDDPAIAPSLVTLTAGAMHVVVAPEVGGALAAYYE